MHDIFSDTVVGVPKFWKEIKKKYKNKFNFSNFMTRNKSLNTELD